MVRKKQVKKQEQWHCTYCSEKINSSEKQVVLITADKGKDIEEIYFHFNCWKDYFNEKVKAKAEKMQTAGSLMDQVSKGKDVVGMIGSLTKMLPKDFMVSLKNLSGDIDPKEVERVIRESGINLNKNKKDDHGTRKSGEQRRNTPRKTPRRDKKGNSKARKN